MSRVFSEEYQGMKNDYFWKVMIEMSVRVESVRGVDEVVTGVGIYVDPLKAREDGVLVWGKFSVIV